MMGHPIPAISLLLVDDHSIIRSGLRALLELDTDLHVVGEADNGRIGITLARELMPDVVLMDVSMPELNGIEASRQIREANPEQKIIMLTMHHDDALIRQSLKAGVRGYLLKDAHETELVKAVKIVAGGGTYFSSPVSDLLLKRFIGREEDIDDSLDLLTNREREVLQLIAEGSNNKQIAEQLEISVSTVESHRKAIMQKLDLHTTAEVIIYAVRKKVVSH